MDGGALSFPTSDFLSCSICKSTSFFVIRPPCPVPCTCDKSIPSSLEIFATTGEMNPSPLSRPWEITGGGDWRSTTISSADLISSTVFISGGDSPSSGRISPGSPIHAITVPALTNVPSSTRMASKVPEAGLGISESTLSVLTSKRGSYSLISSPIFFNHLLTVPSTTDSPSWGMITWMGIFPPSSKYYDDK